MNADARYACLWEYFVHEVHVARFREVYGPDGEWARLFAAADGYFGTRLQRDLRNPLRFVTTDFWATKSARDAFVASVKADYDALDRRCERFTLDERFIGDFEILGGPDEIGVPTDSESTPSP